MGTGESWVQEDTVLTQGLRKEKITGLKAFILSIFLT